MNVITEKQLEQKRKYYAKNRERINEAKRKGREANREKQKEKAREYYSRPEVKKRLKKYYSKPEQREKQRQYAKKYSKEHSKQPEVKERLRKYHIKYYQRPEIKERQKKYYQDPVRKAKQHNIIFQKRNQHAICKYLASKGPLFCKICEVYYSDKTKNEWLLRNFCPCCHRKLKAKKRGTGRPIYPENS